MSLRILFSWEWGTGAGHLRRFAPLGEFLVQQGHDVSIVSKEIGSLGKLFPNNRFRWYQAPVVERSLHRFENPVTIAHVAHNLGLDSEARLMVTLGTWKGLFDAIRPDLVIADFGLSALALAASLQIPVIRIGTGYTCPPQQEHAPEMHFGVDDERGLRKDVPLASWRWQEWLTAALRALHLRAEVGWKELLTGDDRTLLATLPPLDPYASARPTAPYLGTWEQPGTLVPRWSGKSRFKCVAYLKPFRFLPGLLAELAKEGVETWLYGDGIPDDLLRPYHSTLLHICREPIWFDSLRDNCDFAICNANHGTTAKMLALGIPVMAVPLFLEQRITARSIAANGWGVYADPNHGAAYGVALSKLLEPSTKASAIAYANQFQTYHHGALERAIAKLGNMIDEVGP